MHLSLSTKRQRRLYMARCSCLRFLVRAKSWSLQPPGANKNSAAEVGVGIICSCMPVIFVLFKEAFQKIQIKLPSLYYSRFRRGAKGTSSEDSLRLAQQPREQEELAAVPKGTMITLRSIIKNVFGSTTENGTREDEVVLSNMSNFDAGRDTYHARLRDIGSRGEI